MYKNEFQRYMQITPQYISIVNAESKKLYKKYACYFQKSNKKAIVARNINSLI